MKFVETNEPARLPVPKDSVIRLPMGLLGLEQIKEYLLLAFPEEEPFLWLQVVGDANLAFLVVCPFPLAPSYQPNLTADDAEFLGLKEPADALVLSIVTVRGAQEATMNLKGPIILNRHTLVGKQVIPTNAAEYSVQQPLPVTAQ